MNRLGHSEVHSAVRFQSLCFLLWENENHLLVLFLNFAYHGVPLQSEFAESVGGIRALCLQTLAVFAPCPASLYSVWEPGKKELPSESRASLCRQGAQDLLWGRKMSLGGLLSGYFEPVL
jgi:hypothetical protein